LLRKDGPTVGGFVGRAADYSPRGAAIYFGCGVAGGADGGGAVVPVGAAGGAPAGAGAAPAGAPAGAPLAGVGLADGGAFGALEGGGGAPLTTEPGPRCPMIASASAVSMNTTAK